MSHTVSNKVLMNSFFNSLGNDIKYKYSFPEYAGRTRDLVVRINTLEKLIDNLNNDLEKKILIIENLNNKLELEKMKFLLFKNNIEFFNN
jgi:hypothetical protein